MCTTFLLETDRPNKPQSFEVTEKHVSKQITTPTKKVLCETVITWNSLEARSRKLIPEFM